MNDVPHRLNRTVANGSRRTRLAGGWRFGTEIALPGTVDRLDPDVVRESSRSDLDDSSWSEVTLPHTVVPLSWQAWEPAEWEKVWAYRTRFTTPSTSDGVTDQRVFIDFEGAMTSATVTVNDERLGEHRGGYLPFSFEVTHLLRSDSENNLAVIVDARSTINVPPNLPDPALASSIDYWQPGGLHRDVWVRSVPSTFIAEIATTHENVLDPDARRSNFDITLDSSTSRSDLDLEVRIIDAAGSTIAVEHRLLQTLETGRTTTRVEIGGLAAIQLWDVDSPVLYTVQATVNIAGHPVHAETVRTGYREATFLKDGFFLNGTRRYLLGVNRHGLYPYAGFAMPERVQRRDAQILKDELNCVMVRCSHYPQAASFLDACDELGLLVWEESPGWQYVGDSRWQDYAAAEIEAMIARDRHRPSIVIWGARLNETPDRPEFYARTEALVKSLDPTRATSGTMHGDYSRVANFQHDVFSYDDYNTVVGDDGERRPILLPPVEDRPYLISEAISTRSSPTTLYRRAEVARVQQHQALDYAYAHDDALADPRFAGLLAWVGFDYQAGMGNYYHGVKTSGLGDVFRILKPGAAIYRAQVSPTDRIVLEPAFTWDPPEFGQAATYSSRAEAKLFTPGKDAMICSNCDRIEVLLGDELVASATPDRSRFPHLPYAPSFVDLTLDGHDSADLTLVGYLDGQRVATRRFSGDRSGDAIAIKADDLELEADGVDATRVTLTVVDRFGEARGKSKSTAWLELDGPGTIIGDNPFDLEQAGGVGAVWIKSTAEPGIITLRVTAPGLGADAIQISTNRTSAER